MVFGFWFEGVRGGRGGAARGGEWRCGCFLLWGRCGLRLLPVGGLKSGGDGRGEEVREESGGSGVGKKAGRGVLLTAAALMMGEMGGRERGQQIDSNSNTTILEQ